MRGNTRRCQAENPLIALSSFLEPALSFAKLIPDETETLMCFGGRPMNLVAFHQKGIIAESSPESDAVRPCHLGVTVTLCALLCALWHARNACGISTAYAASSGGRCVTGN